MTTPDPTEGEPPTAPEARYPTGAVVPERQRCICDGVCLDHCRACNYSGRDLEEPCIADPDWEPDDEDLARREGLPAASTGTSEDVEALADSIGAELYQSLMEASADVWRRWEFLTDEAKAKYRAEGGRIVNAAAAPVLAAREAAARAAERERIAQAIEALSGNHVRKDRAARIARVARP